MRPLLPLAFVPTLLLAACGRCGEPPPAPPSPGQVRIPDGYGSPWRGEPVVRIRDGRLELPSGRLCAPDEAGCQPALEELRGDPLAVEIAPEQPMARLSAALTALGEALEPGETFCLLAADSDSQRCIPFRPMSGEQFGAWLDAERPLGKIRVVLRADGMEVVADGGKVPGPDRFGPSLPPVTGRPDFEGLDRIMGLMSARFPDEDEAALAPTGGTSAETAVRALGILAGPDARRFSEVSLVYP